MIPLCLHSSPYVLRVICLVSHAHPRAFPVCSRRQQHLVATLCPSWKYRRCELTSILRQKPRHYIRRVNDEAVKYLFVRRLELRSWKKKSFSLCHYAIQMVSRSDEGSDSHWVLTLTIVVWNEAICKPAHSTFSVPCLTFRLPLWRRALRPLRVLRQRWVAHKEWWRAIKSLHLINPFQCHSTLKKKRSVYFHCSRSVGFALWIREKKEFAFQINDVCLLLQRPFTQILPQPMYEGEMSRRGLSLSNEVDIVPVSGIIIGMGKRWKRLMYSPVVDASDTAAGGSGWCIAR